MRGTDVPLKNAAVPGAHRRATPRNHRSPRHRRRNGERPPSRLNGDRALDLRARQSVGAAGPKLHPTRSPMRTRAASPRRQRSARGCRHHDSWSTTSPSTLCRCLFDLRAGVRRTAEVRLGADPLKQQPIWYELGRQLAALHADVTAVPEPHGYLDPHSRTHDPEELLTGFEERDGYLGDEAAPWVRDVLGRLRPRFLRPTRSDGSSTAISPAPTCSSVTTLCTRSSTGTTPDGATLRWTSYPYPYA